MQFFYTDYTLKLKISQRSFIILLNKDNIEEVVEMRLWIFIILNGPRESKNKVINWIQKGKPFENYNFFQIFWGKNLKFAVVINFKTQILKIVLKYRNL